MTLETTIWDPVDRLTSPEAVQAYLSAAFEDGDPCLIAAAIGDVARARGMTEVASKAGLSREALYKAFQPNGNPTLLSLTSVMRVLGLKLDVSPII
jgi:probable addiction module antidote protein